MVIKMNYKIEDNSLVICPNIIKDNILLNLSKNKQLINVKFINIEEFKDNYFGTYKDDAMYFLLKNFNINYDVAKEYLENIFYGYDKLKDIYNDLKENDLLIFNSYFKQELESRNIVVIGYNEIDKCLVDILNKYNAEFIKDVVGTLKPQVYEFKTIDEEINYVANDIINKLDNNTLNDFYLVNVDDAYEIKLKRIFDMYNLPINFNKGNDIFGTITVQTFIKVLIDKRNINDALDAINKNDIYNIIIDCINKYSLPMVVDDEYIEIIKYDLKNIKVKESSYKNAINVISYKEMNDKDKYYYYMNFNEGSVPAKVNDDKLIKDIDRVNLGLNTSFESLQLEKERISKVLSNYPNLIVTYKLKDYFSTYMVSPLVNDLGLIVKQVNAESYEHSNIYNKLRLAEKLDDFYKFNINDSELSDLMTNYQDLEYKTYDNSFKGIDKNILKDYLNNKMNLSYSSLDNYYHCAFRFYISNILKLDPFKDTFMTFLGSLYHFCLSNMYQDNFDLKSLYNEYLGKRDLTNKEKFFVNKLYKDLEDIIEVIKGQDSLSKFNEVMTEKHIAIDKSHDLNINFLGFVDKIKYEEKDGVMWIAIIDYKTGTPMTTLDNINYGLHMQLPIYIYLTSKGLHKDVKIAGFYLQKILNPKKFDSDTPDDDLKNE
jgi:ATP-dependent helicase/DNAse subunit B